MAEADGRASTPVIELRNVSKTFGEVRSLSGVDFAVHPGEIVGLLGDNGAGKSTLVKTVMGYHRPDPGGEIFFEGKRIDDWSVARARGARHRDRLPGARAVREAADLAQHVHGPRAAHPLGPARRQAHARGIRAPDERAHGLHLGGRASRQRRRHHVGRREAGRRHHPRALFRRASWSSSTSRPWGCR